MGRPPTNGAPVFRFSPDEVLEMEAIFQDHNNNKPAREVLVALADKSSNSLKRQGNNSVQTKQIWNWFTNKRSATRAGSSKTTTRLIASTVAPPPPVSVVSTMPAMQDTPDVPLVPPAPVIPVVSKDDHLSPSGLPQSIAASSGKLSADIISVEFEARSARDGAWYDVTEFLSIKNLEAGDPEVLVRFAGFGPEDDEWINVRKNVRHRSLPCETSECVAVLPGDLILCFQEGKEQALYFDAHVLDAQRRRHDVRGCRCRFLVRYDHDQSEEIVQLKKICRRPETDNRVQQLHAVKESSAQQGKSDMSSAEQIKTNSELSFSKAGLGNSITPTVQNTQESNMHANASATGELKGNECCYTDKTTGDINAAPESTQQSHPEVENLDLGTEVQKNILEVKEATSYIAVEETVEKSCINAEKTDAIPMSGSDASKICLSVELTDGDIRTKQTESETAKNEASLVGTDSVVEAGPDDLEQMVVEMDSITDDRKTSIDLGEIDPTSTNDPHMIAGTIIPDTNLPAEAGINIPKGSDHAMNSSVSTSFSLESNVAEASARVVTEKSDVDVDNCTIPNSWENSDHPGECSCPIE